MPVIGPLLRVARSSPGARPMNAGRDDRSGSKRGQSASRPRDRRRRRRAWALWRCPAVRVPGDPVRRWVASPGSGSRSTRGPARGPSRRSAAASGWTGPQCSPTRRRPPTTASRSPRRGGGLPRHPTALIDVTRGVTGASRGIAAVMERLHCDLLLGVDVGGDVLGRGDEAGLASPLCDAVMVSAMLEAAGERRSHPGGDRRRLRRRLAPAQVLDRVAALGRAGAWLGSWGVPREVAAELGTRPAACPGGEPDRRRAPRRQAAGSRSVAAGGRSS